MTTVSPNTFRTLALAAGLRLYAKSGIRPNRNWTPTAMLRTAAKLTGKTYKRGEYLRAADDLKATLEGETE